MYKQRDPPMPICWLMGKRKRKRKKEKERKEKKWEKQKKIKPNVWLRTATF
tara:strand:+ start:476 stop:628 length:153 start_codon:yes stop_codon:yes gene_type:complete